MVTVLLRKTRRELFLSKGMIAAIVCIIAVGTGLLIGMYSTFKDLDTAKISYYSKCRMADFWIDAKKVPLSVLNTINTVGCSEIRTRISFPVLVDLPNAKRPVSGLAMSLPDKPEHVINSIIIRSGSYFSNTSPNEVIVSEKFANARNIVPGDSIDLIMKGQLKKLYVIGTAISSEFVYMTPPGSICPDPNNYGVFWIKRSFAENTFAFQGSCNSIVGILTPESKLHPDEVINKIVKQINPYGVLNHTSLSEQYSNLSLVAELGGLMTMSIAMPLIFLAISALVLNILMLRLAEQRRVETGTLKALGVSNGEILNQCLLFSGFIGLCGGIAGCVIGFVLSSQMVKMYQGFFTFPDLRNSVYPSIMFLAIVISIVFSVLGAIKGTSGILKLSPAESMKPPPPQIIKGIFIERIPWLWKKFDFAWQLVLRSIFRNTFRTISGIIASAFGAAMVFLAIGMYQSLEYMLDFQFEKVVKYDYMISLQDFNSIDAAQDLKKFPGIYYTEPQLNISGTFTNGRFSKQGNISGIIKNSKLIHPCLISGKRLIIPSSGILMSDKIASDLGLKAGDIVDFTPSQGLRKTSQIRIAGIIDSTFGLPVYASFHYLNKILSQESTLNSILIDAKQTPEEKSQFLKKLIQCPAISSVNITAETRNEIDNQLISSLTGTTYVMILFAAVIFLCSILNSSLISISERKREIATLRVLGYTARETGKIFFREIVSINLLGSILGSYRLLDA